ncbi:MAG: site-specific integrase, partial [Candidatus Cybelea sp.]
MSIYLRSCARCVRKSAGERKDRRGRKGCGCRWRATLPPRFGRRTLGVFDTKEKAEAALRKALTDAENGNDITRENLTFSDVAERFFKAVAGDLEAITVERYAENWEQHVKPVLGDLAIKKLKVAHLTDLYARLRTERPRYVKTVANADGTVGERVRFGRTLGPNTCLRIHRFFHRLLKWAVRQEYANRNVADDVEAPKAAPSPARAVSADQVAALLEITERKPLYKPFYPFFVLAATTAMRRGEIGALPWDAVDFERGVATVRQAIGEDRNGNRFIKSTKSKRVRTVPLNALAIAALRRHRANQAEAKMRHRDVYDDRGLVFADEFGGLLDLDRVSKAFAALAREIGIKAKGISLNSFRHYGATQAIHDGHDLKTVAALLGHADSGLTLRVYGHVRPGAQEKAVAGIGEAIAAAQARRAAGESSQGQATDRQGVPAAPELHRIGRSTSPERWPPGRKP